MCDNQELELWCSLNTKETICCGTSLEDMDELDTLDISWIYEGISDCINENWSEFEETLTKAKILLDQKLAIAKNKQQRVDSEQLAVEAIKEVLGNIQATYYINDEEVCLNYDIDYSELVASICNDCLFGWYVNREITIKHNFDGKKFKWLYAKYAYGVNPNQHCTNAIRGKYSKKFNKNNPDFATGQEIVLDEFKEIGWDAIYICGVSTNGYSKHENYPHNVHIAIIPSPGGKDKWCFENWEMSVTNGKFEYVIDEKELDIRFKSLPEHYVTCRMFRWAVSHYQKQIEEMDDSKFDSALYFNK